MKNCKSININELEIVYLVINFFLFTKFFSDFTELNFIRIEKYGICISDGEFFSPLDFISLTYFTILQLIFSDFSYLNLIIMFNDQNKVI